MWLCETDGMNGHSRQIHVNLFTYLLRNNHYCVKGVYYVKSTQIRIGGGNLFTFRALKREPMAFALLLVVSGNNLCNRNNYFSSVFNINKFEWNGLTKVSLVFVVVVAAPTKRRDGCSEVGLLHLSLPLFFWQKREDARTNRKRAAWEREAVEIEKLDRMAINSKRYDTAIIWSNKMQITIN